MRILNTRNFILEKISSRMAFVPVCLSVLILGSCADDTKTKFDLSRDTSIIKDIYLSDNKVSGVACGVIRF